MRTTLAATFLVIAIAGCGSSGGEGGPTPTVQPSPTPTAKPRLFALASVADSDPAAPLRTHLLSSDDLGTTWEILDQGGLADDTIAIAFADRAHGVAAGGTIVQRTDDGGHSWTTQLSDDRHAPDDHLEIGDVAIDRSGTAVAFGNLRNDNFVNAIGFDAWLLPADGATPQAASIAAGGVAPVDSICISAGGAGVATGAFRFTMALVAYNTVFVTGDAGASWTVGAKSVIDNQAVGWNGTGCSGSSNLWLFGGASIGGVIDPSPPQFAIAHSADGGTTWVGQGVLGAVPGGLSDASFVDDRTGWAVGYAALSAVPVVVHTSDGGDNWAFQTMPADVRGGLGDVAFLDRNFGIAGGVALPDPVTSRLPLVLITEDGGSSWRQVELPPGLGAVLRVAVTP